MIPIIKWELSRRRTYLIAWCAGTAILVLTLMSIYPSIHQQAAQLDQVMRQLPESVRSLRGGDSDITSPVGYLNSELFYISLPLLLIILTVSLGSGILAKEEQDHTLELLLARPVSRGKILLAKALSGTVITLLVGLVATLVIIALNRPVGLDVSVRYLLLAGTFTTFFALGFGAIAFALSAASVVSRRIGVTVAIVASFGGYLLASLSGLSDFIKTPAKFLPYHYYAPDQILRGNISRGLVLYLIGIFVVCAIVSWFGFRRRDIS